MIKKLNVPFFSQMDNKYSWGDGYKYVYNSSDTAYRTCGITCLTMVLHYYGLIKMTVDDILKELHTPGTELNRLYTEPLKCDESNGDLCYVWGKKAGENHKPNEFNVLYELPNLSRIADFFLNKSGKTRYLQTPYIFCNWGNALSIEKAKEKLAQGIPVIIQGGFTDTDIVGQGHFVLLRGFTDDIFFINDPYGDPRINANDKELEIIKEGKVHPYCKYAGKLSDQTNPKTGKRYGENIEIEISSLKKVLTEKGEFINFVAVEGPVPNAINLPTDGDSSSLPLHWYHKTEMVPGGFYPIASNRCAHGGAHLCGNGSTMLVKAMAPGYIVAFRFFSTKSEENFNRNHNKKLVQEDGNAYFVDPSYSSFILIRHELTDMPDKKETPRQKMPFYSLYMNLAPVDSGSLEQVPWLKQLYDLLNGASTSIDFDTLGEIEWKYNEAKLYRTARSSGDPLSSLKIKSDMIPLVNGEEGKVVTFSQPLLKVSSGEVIGCSKKMTTDVTNFIHWEIFSPASKDSLKKIVDLYINNKGSINIKEINETDNFLTVGELSNVFTDLNISELFSIAFVNVTSDWSKIIATSKLSQINPFFDTNILKQFKDKPIPFGYWLYLDFLKNNSYEITISATWPSSYEIEKTKKLCISCTISSYKDDNIVFPLKGEKSGSTYTFYLPSIGDEEERGTIEPLPLSIDEFKKGINVKLPIHAKEIIIEQNDSDKVLASATLDASDGEKTLFEREVDKHLRNFKLCHKAEWTSEANKNLITALKDNHIISESYNYKEEDFIEITWLDENKEFKIYDSLFGSKGMVPSMSDFVHLHPATTAWMLSLLSKAEKISFDESVLPDEFLKKNPLKYYAFSVSSTGSARMLGESVRLFVAGEFIRPDNTPPRKVTIPDTIGDMYTILLDQYGQWRVDFTLDYWGTYSLTTETPEFIDKKPSNGQLLKEIKVEKSLLKDLYIEDSVEESSNTNFKRNMFLLFQNSATTPAFLPVVLYFQFAKGTDRTKITEWKEFEKGLLTGFIPEKDIVAGRLISSFTPQEIYKEIIKSAKNIAAGETIFLRYTVVSPNGGLKKIADSLTRELANAGNTLIPKKRTDLIKDKTITSLPDGGGFLDFDDLQLPKLNAPANPVLEVALRGTEIRGLGYAVFENEAYKWTTVDDYAVSAQIVDGSDAVKVDKIAASETIIQQKNGENRLEALIDLKSEYFSKDKTKPNKIKYKFSYPPKNPYIEATCTFPLGNPDITDIKCTRDETSGEMVVTGVKKNIPEWMILILKIEWKGNDKAIVPVSWTLFCKEVATLGNEIRFTVPSDQYVSNTCTLTFCPGIKDVTAFPTEIKIDKEQNPGVSSTKFKTKTITEEVKFRKEAKDKSEYDFCLEPGQIVRSILDSEDNEIIHADKEGKYESVEFSNTDKKISYKGWIITEGLK